MITWNECRVLRVFATILLLFSLFSFVLNVWAIRTIRTTSTISNRDRTLILSIFVSSLCVLVISVPSVVVQLFLCQPIRSPVICQLEGLNSLFNSCLSMYVLAVLSIVHYISTAHSTCFLTLHQHFEKHRFLLVVFCFVLSWILDDSTALRPIQRVRSLKDSGFIVV